MFFDVSRKQESYNDSVHEEMWCLGAMKQPASVPLREWTMGSTICKFMALAISEISRPRNQQISSAKILEEAPISSHRIREQVSPTNPTSV